MPVERTSLSQIVYNELKRRILSKEYAANELITEKKIAAELKVSNTPVREALNVLCQEGFVTRYPNFGYIIRELNYKEVKEIFELRFILESAAVRLIIKYATDDEIKSLYDYVGVQETSTANDYGKNTQFHRQLGKLTGNSYLADDIFRLVVSIARPSTYLNHEEAGLSTGESHDRIIDALLARDIDQAIKYLKLDILSGKNREI